MADEDRIRRALTRLNGLQQSLPQERASYPGRYWRDFTDGILAVMEAGLDLSDFMIPEREVKPIVAGGNYITGEVTYSKEPYVDGPLLRARLASVIEYVTSQLGWKSSGASENKLFGGITITGGNVTFGDGAHINITTVTVGDVLRRLETEINAKVHDPQERFLKASGF